MAKTYPEGTKHLQWFLAKEGDKMIVRRHLISPDGKRHFERLPTIKYSHIKTKRELEDFVIRLNGKDPAFERVKARIAFKHAYISDDLMDDYRENYLYQQVPTRKDAQSMYGYLNNYCLNFFIEKLGLKNPLDWHRSQNLWGRYLLNKGDELEEDKLIFEAGEIKSAKVIRVTINELNRFMKYLHLKRADEVPYLKFEPISKAAFKEHEARRKMGKVHTSKYIKPDHWTKIVKHLDENKVAWRFAAYIAFGYGLRRNETMGVQLSDVRKSHLSCERQFDKFDTEIRYKPLKNRLPRRVPHWFCKPSELHALIKGMQENILHPDTISNSFSALMHDLELPEYTFHDIRRTFITNAVKAKVEPEDLRLAVGHSHINTTYKYYVMDARELEDGIWSPEEDEAA